MDESEFESESYDKEGKCVDFREIRYCDDFPAYLTIGDCVICRIQKK